MEPMTAMGAVLSATQRLRVLSLVLANDFRHPVVLHKMAATLDALSGGRVELGLGAGWMKDDYVAAGIPFDLPGVRVSRLAESIRVLKGLFGPEPFSFEGQHYRIANLDGLPKPAQQPHPPILVGGGSRSILRLAAREADIVGVHCRLRAAEDTAEAAGDFHASRIAQKVEWVRQAAHETGRDLESMDLQFTVYYCHITRSAAEVESVSSWFADSLRADPALLATSPAVLAGTLDQCVETLCERRERYGFNYLKLNGDIANVAPLVARLAGQ
jgi:probable F420-dependent oxidoreductase